LTIVIALLLIPLLAMQLSDEVNWNLMDFVVAAALLMIAVGLIDHVIRNVKGNKRIIIVIVVVLLLLMIWAQLAVRLIELSLVH